VQKVWLADGSHLLITVKVFQTGDGRRYLIESGGPLAPIETILSQVLLSLLLGVPLLGLVAVGGGLFLVGRALAPVVKIGQSAEQITQHNLNERLPLTHTGDELERLSLALNRMIVRLSEAFEQNRRFLADASHELRTPLAALRGEMESVVEQTRALPELSDRAGSVLEEVDRLAKIVDALFALSRLDAGEAQQEHVCFDLARLAAGTTEQMSLLAEDKGVAVACRVQPNVGVAGDRARIKQVVVNLLDNAIKYTPAGGSIQLEVQAREGKAVLQVSDTGIGIPAGALPHIFERFFRVDKARSRDAGGAGLGLAIVKSICMAHGGQVFVESTEGRGSRIKVELPLAPSQPGKTD
jgi:heavy metal sensor kinase